MGGFIAGKEKNKEVFLSEEDAELRKELTSIYTPLSVAKKEIWRRWNDKVLRKKVEDFLGGDVPEFLKDAPKAYLAKHVASPNLNFFEYFNLAGRIGLDTAIPEFRNDKFVSINDDKYHLGKMFLFGGNGRKGGLKIKTKVLIDFNLFEGKKFSEIKTFNGEGFIDFYHKMMEAAEPGICKNIFDISDWIERKGGNSEKFYRNFLALFICNAVLFENFLSKKEDDRKFSRNVVLNSFKEVSNFFGVKPLIVPTVPIEKENDFSLWCYPQKLEACLK